MSKKFKFLGLVFLTLALVVGVGASSANATLTLEALTITSNGALTLDGAAASAITVGSATTTGNIAIGGALTTGTLTLGKTTQTGITVISGSTSGANTLFNNVTGGTIAIGVANTGGINIGAGNTAKTIAIGTGTAVDTINIGTGGTGIDVISIGDSLASLALTDAQWSVTSPGVATFVNTLVSPSATLGLDVGSAGNLQLGGVTATSVGIGSASVGALTVTTNGTGTAEVVLPDGSISTAEILDDTVGVADLAASLAFADADLVSFASVSVSSATEGLIFPQHATDCSIAGTAEGQVCWEADANTLYIGDGTTVTQAIGNVSGNNTWTGTNAFNGTSATFGDAATDTLTITSTVQGASPLVFEGLTANDFELTFAIPDVGADATITFPSVTGTLATLAGTETLTNKTFVAPALGAATSTSLATSAATPLLLTNGQLVNIALTSQTVGATILTIPDFASVADTFVFTTLAQTLSNKTFVAPALGAATATSVNGLTITSSTGTLTIAAGKTVTVSNTLTFAGTDASSVAFGAGGTVTYTSNNLSVFAATTSLQLLGVISDEQGSGALVFATSPTLTTPNIGAATGTSLAATGAITSSGTAGIGYATGAGGIVTQATSKATAFTLSKITGQITTAADALAAGTIVSATWTNTVIAATDIVVVTHVSGGTLGAYTINVAAGAGSATFTLRNNTAGSLSEALVIGFAVIKGAIN